MLNYDKYAIKYNGQKLFLACFVTGQDAFYHVEAIEEMDQTRLQTSGQNLEEISQVRDQMAEDLFLHDKDFTKITATAAHMEGFLDALCFTHNDYVKMFTASEWELLTGKQLNIDKIIGLEL